MIKRTLAVAAVLSALSGPVLATPISMNNGIDWASDADTSTSTAAFDELGYTGTRATSIYLGSPATVGTVVVDTNETSVMNFYGFSAGSKTTIGGATVSASYPVIPFGLNVDALNTTALGNGFSNAQLFPYGTSGTWGLTYDYTITGVITATGISFNSGYFKIYYEDGVVRKQVGLLNVSGSTLNAANLDVFGTFSFDFNGDTIDNDADAFVKNFWKSEAPFGDTFYNVWAANKDGVAWSLDTNVNPPIPSVNDLWVSSTGALIRQTSLDGSIVFNVPEPGSLALMGLGLLGFGLSRRVKRQAA